MHSRVGLNYSFLPQSDFKNNISDKDDDDFMIHVFISATNNIQ